MSPQESLTVVSVIVPVKSVDKFTQSAINSIVDQSEKSIEIILVCDTLEIGQLKKIIDSDNLNRNNNLKIISPTIKGISAALNAGINASVGRYIARMDSDDISEKDRIEVQRKVLDDNKSIFVLSSNASVIDEAGEIVRQNLLSTKVGLSPIGIRLLFGNFIVHPTVMMRRECVETIGGYSPVASEDYDLWIRIFDRFSGSLYIINRPLIKYRIHDQQLSYINYLQSNIAMVASLFRSILVCPRSIKVILLALLVIKILLIKIKIKIWKTQ